MAVEGFVRVLQLKTVATSYPQPIFPRQRVKSALVHLQAFCCSANELDQQKKCLRTRLRLRHPRIMATSSILQDVVHQGDRDKFPQDVQALPRT